MTLYDLLPGEAICPYHFPLGDEEWLIVVPGTPTVRTPEGEPEGAHRIHSWDGERL
jgi:uncharacterized cupin superfamily protein